MSLPKHVPCYLYCHTYYGVNNIKIITNIHKENINEYP